MNISYNNDAHLSREDYKNMYWDQIKKRKGYEKIIERYRINCNLENNNNDIKELEKRIDLLEQNYVDGTVIGLSENFLTIRSKYGEISIHKSKLNKNELLYGKNMNRQCKFKLSYHLNRYQGKDLILL